MAGNMKIRTLTTVRTKHEMAQLYAAGSLAEPERSEFESLLDHDATLLKYAAELLDIDVSEFVNGLRWVQHPAPVVWRRIQDRLFPPDISEEKLPALGVTNTDFLALLDVEGVISWANPAFSEWSGRSSGTLAASLGDLQDPRQSELQTIVRLVSALRNGQATEANAIFHSSDSRPGSVLVRIVPMTRDLSEFRNFLLIGRKIAS